MESCLSTSPARVRTDLLVRERVDRGGSTASVAMASSALSTASRIARGPARIFRSNAAITRAEVKRRRPSTAAFTMPIVSDSRKMPAYSNQSSSVERAEKERMA
mgnify:CR=1 FL=1